MLRGTGVISCPDDLVSSAHSDLRGQGPRGRHCQIRYPEPGDALLRIEHRGVQTRLDWAKARNGFSNTGLQSRQAGDHSWVREVADLREEVEVGLKAVEAGTAACGPSRSPCSRQLAY